MLVYLKQTKAPKRWWDWISNPTLSCILVKQLGEEWGTFPVGLWHACFTLWPCSQTHFILSGCERRTEASAEPFAEQDGEAGKGHTARSQTALSSFPLPVGQSCHFSVMNRNKYSNKAGCTRSRGASVPRGSATSIQSELERHVILLLHIR